MSQTHAAADGGSTTRTPRWVKVFGIIAVGVILLFVILLITRGPHRPGRHLPGAPGGQPPLSSASVIEHDVQKP